MAQVFDGQGKRVGGEITVAPFQSGSREETPGEPAVAMDPAGDFVVAWYESQSFAVRAQRFSANGAPVGGLITVDDKNAFIAQPQVAMDANGDFVVAYDSTDGARDDLVAAAMFNANGTLTKRLTLPQQDGFDSLPSVAEAPDGRFVIALQEHGQVRLDQFNPQGVEVGIPLMLGAGQSPSVAMDVAGNCVVAWLDLHNNVVAQRVVPVTDTRGNTTDLLGQVLRIGHGTQPVLSGRHLGVGLDPFGPNGGGNFVVAYEQQWFNGDVVMVTEVTNNDTRFTTDVVGGVGDGTVNLLAPSISINSDHQYLVSGTDQHYGAEPSNITAQFGTLQDQPPLPPVPYPSAGGAGGASGATIDHTAGPAGTFVPPGLVPAGYYHPPKNTLM
jgi:hypothetical protein